MGTPLFDRIAIVGPGLIGGSLGMALKSRGMARSIVGVGHRRESLDLALGMRAVDEVTLDLPSAVPDADLVVLAAGVGKICEHIEAVVPRMKSGAVLTDVGSVKGAICRKARETLARHPDGGVAFVGAHPLAGSERRGIRHARRDLYRDAVCLLTPTPETDTSAAERVEEIWRGVGCRVLRLPPDVHDRLLAQVSHLPHVAAACLVNAVCDDALALAAGGFRDTTRVASGDPTLWRDICTANRDALAPALRSLADELKRFADGLDSADADAVAALLAKAKARRDADLTGAQQGV